MDSLSTKKRQEDGICRLGMNQPHRLKQRSLSQNRIELLREEQKQAQAWREKIEKDRIMQKTNLSALNRAIKASRDFGGPRYRTIPVTKGEERPPEYASAVTNFTRTQTELGNLMDQIKNIDKSHLSDTSQELKAMNSSLSTGDIKGDVQGGGSINSMQAWFARYGEPRRMPQKEERVRSFNFPVRNRPFDVPSQAITVRYGGGIWNDYPMGGTWSFKALGRPEPKVEI
eukprot:TRINITY_DN20496_c0_g1_i1.p1 TRINITY_DN20496_c0_g1~~TRINITY_DN20496_c0_g1_i1.p1  ORF type:complete len:229 (-),score=50.95 TRINITY_DN20496_c0_g1_i1:33-719(-)